MNYISHLVEFYTRLSLSLSLSLSVSVSVSVSVYLSFSLSLSLSLHFGGRECVCSKECVSVCVLENSRILLFPLLGLPPQRFLLRG